MSDFLFTDGQPDVLEPVQAIIRALPPTESPELIEALIAQFVNVFRHDWPEFGEDEVQRYSDLVRVSLSDDSERQASQAVRTGWPLPHCSARCPSEDARQTVRKTAHVGGVLAIKDARLIEEQARRILAHGIALGKRRQRRHQILAGVVRIALSSFQSVIRNSSHNGAVEGSLL